MYTYILGEQSVEYTDCKRAVGWRVPRGQLGPVGDSFVGGLCGLCSHGSLSLCSPGCPEIYSIDQGGLKLRDSSASAS